MTKTPEDSATLASMAQDLDVRLETADGGGQVSPAGWCAGNDCRCVLVGAWELGNEEPLCCRLIPLLWRAMASGNAVDEQQAAVEARRRESSSNAVVEQPVADEAANPEEPGEWDDDRDPNDIIPAPANNAASSTLSSNPYEEWENEEYEAD